MKFKVPVRGVHIGHACVSGDPFTDDVAHAHVTGSQPRRFVGFICAKTLSDLRDHLTHEIAHLAADTGHDDRWRRSVRRLGGRVPAAYRRKPKRKS